MSSDEEDDYEESVWSSSEQEEFESDGEKFEAEIGAYGRVGFPGSDLVGKTPTSRLERSTQEPIERFRQRVNAVSQKIKNLNESDIDQSNIIEMLTMAANLDVVEHKNPTAYVLGYLASGGGVSLSSTKDFNYVIENLLPHLDEYVLPPDVIRYARLWLNLKK
jgi:hypothetical protein